MRYLLFFLLATGFWAGCARQETAVPAAPDTARAVVVADSAVTVPRAVLDSLHADMARMQAALAALQRDTARTAAPAQAPKATTEQVVRDAREAVQSYGLKVFWALVMLVLAQFVLRGTVYVLDRLSERGAARRLFYKRLVPIARILIWTLAAYIIVRIIFEIEAQGLLAAAAAIGVAIGFAAQDILKNIFGGLVIIFDQPFQVGDKIAVGGTYGEVVGIGLRSTRIVTPDDNLVSVPNAQVVDGQVANANAGALDCQVVTDLYLPGWVDETKAKQLAYEAAASSKYVYLDKPIVVIVKDEFKETFITHLKVKAYVLDTRYEFLLMSDVTERARAAFRREGLLHAMHGARAYVDLTALPPANGDAPTPA